MRINIMKSAATLLALAGMIAVTACDHVAADDRYIDMGEIKAERAVLLEDFTGQDCSNCPNAHEAIEELEAQYGRDKVIAVSIHCGGLAISTEDTDFDDGYVGLMTRQGNRFMMAYGITQWPMGVVNGGSPLDWQQWADAVRTALAETTDISLKLDVAFDREASDNGTIKMTAHVMSTEAQKANIQFWVTENKIVADQKLPSGQVNKEYVHNNVFRAAVYNSQKGEEIELGADFEQTFDAELDCRWSDTEHWVPENLEVICFVSNDKGVQQVVRVPVVIAE